MTSGGRPERRPLVLFGRGTDTDAVTLTDLLRRETVGGVLMLLAAAAAVVWANLDHAGYEHVRELHLGPLTLEAWASDGLLTIFFFVAGLELKRELTVGSLSRPAEAVVPMIAAVCGMAVPALIYLVVNLSGSSGHPGGWAIPMATDIAFALAVLAVAAPSLPTSLRAFLLTLAIVDDLGAIVVIAVVFTEEIRLGWLAVAVAVAALWWLLQRRRVRGWYLYLPLGVLCWFAMLSSGVHPTIAGVLLGLLSRSSATDPEAPVRAWEHRWQPVSAGFAVPVFAVLAAGVTVSPSVLAQLVTAPVGLGVVVGLLVGKPVGVLGGAYLSARFTRAELAPDLRWSEVFSVSVLAGVGFTVALLISDLAFPGDPALRERAKAAVLLASLLAGLLAAVSLRRRASTRATDA
ncbi:Na+/H+ antiporter NhaA [uncultured Friedmanniella sp.]|uniref:Na+/H+ antiporter NhaA n=1 Tax=uncultured Friedmanniella sp. TaxID=335381 RepID=UPI0035CA1F00